ncbi:DUF4429 domain-containing protein [Streptomyces sp. NPDC056707]|uniref:DUF4429 domain-containing protein n=1 Tax=Streptomyces sp. NPDC056707 TaxID=3345919 RepID=UPI0036C3F578
MEAKGHGGQVDFDGQYVTIKRKGFLARSVVGKGEKRLHISNITAVQWKPAGMMVNGFIQFTVPGGNELKSSFGSQTSSAMQDENSVVFTKQQQPKFEILRAAIDTAIVQHRAPQVAQVRLVSVADELAKLGTLLQQGMLTQREFDQQKARLLGM